ITDLVMTNGIQPEELTVHEDLSLGGSDHRPLTFSIGAAIHSGWQFVRWNIRKLIAQYQHHLASTLSSLLQSMAATNVINAKWGLFKQWIEAAALRSCGKLSYQDCY